MCSWPGALQTDRHTTGKCHGFYYIRTIQLPFKNDGHGGGGAAGDRGLRPAPAPPTFGARPASLPLPHFGARLAPPLSAGLTSPCSITWPHPHLHPPCHQSGPPSPSTPSPVRPPSPSTPSPLPAGSRQGMASSAGLALLLPSVCSIFTPCRKRGGGQQGWNPASGPVPSFPSSGPTPLIWARICSHPHRGSGPGLLSACPSPSGTVALTPFPHPLAPPPPPPPRPVP